jgi:hypothetical protein
VVAIMKAEGPADTAFPSSNDSTSIDEIEESLRRLANKPDRHLLTSIDARLREFPDSAATPKVVGLVVQLCTLWLHLGEAG